MHISERFKFALVATALIVLVAAAHGTMLQNGFVPLDDVLYIQGNNHVLGGFSWGAIKWAFSTTDGGNWHPLTWLTHMLDAQLFGDNPAGHHLGNLLLHCANTVLLFLWLLRMTGAWWRCAAVAALWAVHPMHVESVAWISERKDVLCAFFVLIGLVFYTRYVRKPGIARYFCVAGSLALALMCKPMAVTFPFVLLLLDYWPLERMKAKAASSGTTRFFPLRLVAEKIPFMVIAGIFSVICLAAQRHNMAMSDLAVIPMALRIKNAMVSCVDYLGLAFFPSGLNALYSYPYDISTVYAVGCAVFLLVLLFAALFRAKQAPYLPVGLLWFAGMLFPVIGIVQVGIQAKADRYAYLPYIGLYVAVVWGVCSLVANRPKLRLGGAIAFLIIIALLVNTTRRQVRTWQNGVTLFERMLEVNPHNMIAMYNLGGLLYTQERFQEAADVLEKYFKRDPWKPQALQILTDALVELKKYDKAMMYMKYLTDAMPEDSETLAKLSYIALMRGDVEYSIDALHAANKFEQDTKKRQQRVTSFVGLLLENASKVDQDKGIVYYESALLLDPYNVRALVSLARLELKHGDLADAVVFLTLAKRQSPDSEAVRALLQQLLKPLDTPENAIVLRQIAWKLATDPQKVRRDGEYAVEYAVRAIALQGKETALTADALAAALAESGHFGQAQRTARRAAELAKQAGRLQYAAEIAARQKRYAAQKPFHSNP